MSLPNMFQRKLNKAFIFDMDGVIVDSENAWSVYGSSQVAKLFGEDIARQIGDTIGMTLREEYDKAVQFGYTTSRNEFYNKYDKIAEYVFSKAELSLGINNLGEKLILLDYKIGIVSSSRQKWINFVLPKLKFRKNIECIISITDREELEPKPSPQAYIEAIKELGVEPQATIILEDSNRGIKSAKASGAYTIGFNQNLVPGYIQEGADRYAQDMQDVIKIVEEFNPQKDYQL